MKNANVLASECYFRYNDLGISLQNGQTFLLTTELVDYLLCSQSFFMCENILWEETECTM